MTSLDAPETPIDFSLLNAVLSRYSPPSSDDPFFAFCTEEIIIEMLIRQKCKRVTRRHMALQRGRYRERTGPISNLDRFKGWDKLFIEIFPSRREIWELSRSAKRAMIDKARSEGDVIDNSVFYAKALRRTLRSPRFRENAKFKRLQSFCRFIQYKILDADKRGFHAPLLRVRPKDAENKKFRVISIYSMIDSVILSLLAMYLAKAYDAVLTPSALAYRSGKGKSGHNEAFGRVYDWVASHRDENNIYFFEYDFKNFYDSIPHRVIQERFRALHREAVRKRHPAKWSSLASSLIKKYLASYSYQYVLEHISLRCSESFRAEVLAQLDRIGLEEPCGIAQGTTLSCFLSNVVLHPLDKAMRRHFKEEKNGLFARYCDDSLVLGLNEECTKAAENIYERVADSLRLKYHSSDRDSPIRYIGDGRRKYWESKSKATRRWGNPRPDGRAAPFLSFVGYQLKYTGEVFIRPSSVRKEVVKQRKVVNDAIRSVVGLSKRGRRSRYTHREFIHSVLGRLCAMSVGFASICREFGRSEKCWVDAWSLLGRPDVAYSPAQMRHLSERRNWAVRKLLWFVRNNRHMFAKRSSASESGASEVTTSDLLRGVYTYRVAVEERREWVRRDESGVTAI